MLGVARGVGPIHSRPTRPSSMSQRDDWQSVATRVKLLKLSCDCAHL
ncbi:hypothetical protein HMPREF9603_00430 [Cutibacterium acnes HL001PA1]|nr:hypothetical protein HMPREF9603_00430 [Cutibacterium acnes HL001PA1]EFT09184.1 hypothetical protein HMPREF9619_02361 [Cutibacterium acnes HL082PA2]